MNRIVTLTSELIPALMPEKLSSLASSVLALLPSESPDPDATRTVPELIESRGFKAETYEIPTPDGFILVLHRIINPHAEKLGLKCKPILLGHGIAAHSGHWLINSDDGQLEPWANVDKNQNESNPPAPAPANGHRDGSTSHRSCSSAYSSLTSSSRDSKKAKKRTGNNLGFVLANLGYDVWMLNWRGNRYSYRHKKLTPSEPEYWNFTLDDFVQYDLPAFVNFILDKTGANNISYVGMSQGSNVMFALLASKPSFNKKIKPFIALCPAVKISNAIRVPVPFVKAKIPVPDLIKVPALRIFNYCLMSSGHGPVLPFADNLAAMFTPGSLSQHYFEHLTYLLSSSFFDLNLNRDRMTVYTSQANFALSRKNLAHLVQTIIYEEFAKFDYGEDDNQEIYGKLDPPEYDISAITNRTVALIYSSNDEWASVQDFESIGQRMRVPLLEDHLIPEPKWSHYDFTFGTNVGPVVNDKIISILKKAEKVPDDELVIDY